jgi:hypothetical protein
MYRTATLRVLTWRFTGVSAPVPRTPIAAAIVLAPLFGRAVSELRLQSPADYDSLAHVRALLDGGQWIIDPLACVAAVLARVGAVDPMQVLRFLQPLLLCGAVCATALLVYRIARSRLAAFAAMAASTMLVTGGIVNAPSTSVTLGLMFAGAGIVLLLVAAEGLHQRDRCHVLVAWLVAFCVFSRLQPSALGAAGYVEYDAAARAALRIARTVPAGQWTIVGPREQYLEIAKSDAYLDLGEFVRRYRTRAGLRQFRFDLPGRYVFVVTEKRPLTVNQASLFPATVGAVGGSYLPNTRARLQRETLELCENYSRTHACASIYYEDADVRVYQFCR